MPSADVSGGTGRTSSFEVTANNVLKYSKLASGAFPDFAALAKEIVSNVSK